MSTARSPILQEDQTCWRVAECTRAKVLIDAAAYFAALRRALLEARRSVFILGWDIDSRTRLVGPRGDKPSSGEMFTTASQSCVPR